MRVCQISREEDRILVDGVEAGSVEEAYNVFRLKYNKTLGKANHLKLGHRGVRTTRITKPGMFLTPEYRQRLEKEYGNTGRVRWYLMGVLATSYSKMTGCDFFDKVYEGFTGQQADEYLDWVFSRGSAMLVQYGRRDDKWTKLYKVQDNGRKNENR